MSPDAPAAAGFRAGAPKLRQAAETLSQRLPALLVEAERVAATVAPGVHGRRRTGMGETFWQFRQYQAGDAAEEIDLAPIGPLAPPARARAGVESAESVWIWCDFSDSMAFRSGPKLLLKWERAVLLTPALAAPPCAAANGSRCSAAASGRPPAGSAWRP